MHDRQLLVAFPVLEGRHLMLARLLPAGGLTFLFRQESKQRSRPGEALHKIFRYGAVSLTFLPDFIAALSRPSPGAARQFSGSVIVFLAIRRSTKQTANRNLASQLTALRIRVGNDLCVIP